MSEFEQAMQKARDELARVSVNVEDAIKMISKVTYKSKPGPDDMRIIIEAQKILKKCRL